MKLIYEEKILKYKSSGDFQERQDLINNFKKQGWKIEADIYLPTSTFNYNSIIRISRNVKS